ncbi:alkyl sulfatase C-terminal domain-containing protein [Streptomyces sp. cg28]|uniref:alkyl sulfatase C-terminal domain-containing protein n=1 Tax=Streptomyces sp. cg28 TaxID=3403457 RepID=UPI003B20EB98
MPGSIRAGTPPTCQRPSAVAVSAWRWPCRAACVRGTAAARGPLRSRWPAGAGAGWSRWHGRCSRAGGADAALDKARGYVDAGDLCFAATLLNHIVFADPSRTDAKELLAQVYERLGHGAENGTWRNFYPTAAMELRHGANPISVDTNNPEMAMALTTEMLLDSIAIRIDGPSAWDEDLTIDLNLTDEGRRYRLTLHNGVLTHRVVTAPRTEAGLTLTLTKPQLLGIVAGTGLDGVQTDGDPQLLARLFSPVTEFDKSFAIVTP